jgi:hypothetical protein
MKDDSADFAALLSLGGAVHVSAGAAHSGFFENHLFRSKI